MDENFQTPQKEDEDVDFNNRDTRRSHRKMRMVGENSHRPQ